jgi:[ribosomal protein S18]-alanine N-acetyltransferase
MTIRPARLADAADLSRIHTASFDDGWTTEDFATWLSRGEAMAVLAIRERETVAFGLALESGADAELLTIATAPPERRSGWGRQIFRALDEEARARGLERWILEVARNNVAAQGLYRSQGFVEIGVRKDYYRAGEGRVDALVMSRRVGPQGGQDGG